MLNIKQVKTAANNNIIANSLNKTYNNTLKIFDKSEKLQKYQFNRYKSLVKLQDDNKNCDFISQKKIKNISQGKKNDLLESSGNKSVLQRSGSNSINKLQTDKQYHNNIQQVIGLYNYNNNIFEQQKRIKQIIGDKKQTQKNVDSQTDIQTKVLKKTDEKSINNILPIINNFKQENQNNNKTFVTQIKQNQELLKLQDEDIKNIYNKKNNNINIDLKYKSLDQLQLQSQSQIKFQINKNINENLKVHKKKNNNQTSTKFFTKIESQIKCLQVEYNLLENQLQNLSVKSSNRNYIGANKKKNLQKSRTLDQTNQDEINEQKLYKYLTQMKIQNEQNFLFRRDLNYQNAQQQQKYQKLNEKKKYHANKYYKYNSLNKKIGLKTLNEFSNKVRKQFFKTFQYENQFDFKKFEKQEKQKDIKIKQNQIIKVKNKKIIDQIPVENFTGWENDQSEKSLI